MTFKPFQIDNVQTEEKAKEIAEKMRLLFEDWNVEIIGKKAPYSVRRSPPGAAPAASSAASSTVTPPVQAFLDFIASCESSGNYNARFGDASNSDDPNFTAMTVDDVLLWQKGRKFSACGKYQIIRATLSELKAKMDLTGAELFDKELQDQMALLLLRGRGLDNFLSGALAREDFALSVAREWAALPGVKSPHGEKSVYAGDGVNHALVSAEDYLSEIDKLLA